MVRIIRERVEYNKREKAYMKLPTDNRRSKVVAAIALALMLLPAIGYAQVASSNPLEYVALAEGKRAYQRSDQNQIEDQQKTAFLQNTIAAEFSQTSQMGKEV